MFELSLSIYKNFGQLPTLLESLGGNNKERAKNGELVSFSKSYPNDICMFLKTAIDVQKRLQNQSKPHRHLLPFFFNQMYIKYLVKDTDSDTTKYYKKRWIHGFKTKLIKNLNQADFACALLNPTMRFITYENTLGILYVTCFLFYVFNINYIFCQVKWLIIKLIIKH